MKIKINKKTFSFFSLALALLGILFFAQPVYAESNWAADILTGLLGYIISGLGLILLIVIRGVVLIASYQNFIGAEAVLLGWKMVRDICNMFFVVVLLIIAFGTILNIEAYNYKKWLPKLILFAVLINFSKTICGLLIDVSQIVMLTFVNAFKDMAGGNFADALGIIDIFEMDASEKEEASAWEIVGAYFLGVVYMIVAIVVMATMVMMLAMRVVMIWLYVVLSPAAYLLAAFPGGQRFASQWWGDFIKNLVVGPVLAFFIWLSLASLVGDKTRNSFDNPTLDANSSSETANVNGRLGDDGTSVAATSGSKPSSFIRFAVGIGMLVGGLMIAQQIGGASGSMAGKGMARLQKGAAFAGGVAVGAVVKPVKGAVKGSTSFAADKLQQKTGVDLNLKRVWEGVKAKRKDIQGKRYAEGQIAASQAMEKGGTLRGMLAMTGSPGDAWEQMTSLRGIKKRLKGGKRMGRDLEKARLDKQRALDGGLENLKFRSDWMEADPARREEMRASLENDHAVNTANRDNAQVNLRRINRDILEEENKPEKDRDSARLKDLEQEREKEKENLAKYQEKISLHDSLQFEEAWLATGPIERRFRGNNLNNEANENEESQKSVQNNLDGINRDLNQTRDAIVQERDAIVREKEETGRDRDESVLRDLEAELQRLVDRKVVAEENLSNHQRRGEDISSQQAFAKKYEMGSKYSEEDKRIARKNLDNKIPDIDKRISQNTPEYNFEARAAENSLVSKEMGKIKGIDSSDELLRMLQDAMVKKDKTLIKAISIKMAKDGSETAFLQNIGGSTDHNGLKSFIQNLIRQSGFNEQEAFSLGSQISETAKSTNHWAASHAYTIDNGKWRETTEEEHTKLRTQGVASRSQQQFMRDVSPLAFGTKDSNGNLELDASGVMQLDGMNSAEGHKNIITHMNEAVAKSILKAIRANQNLVDKYNEERNLVYSNGIPRSLIGALEERLKNNVDDNFEEKFREAKNMFS